MNLWNRIDKTKSCWIWEGCLSTAGYGVISINNKRRYVHRVVYELLVDKIPSGMVIDHLCRNPSCCNPRHLEVVTPKTNTLRGISVSAVNSKKTHCIRGHSFIGKDSNVYITKKGYRLCRYCFQIRKRHYRLQARGIV